ncbi:SURF1 family protein [Ramlibacter sp. AN1015]|uniref:SURF1 family protein n=1 Tax=Ramlibacter sp. AN1015 TaxID=3133428 RepID=UPI0030BBCCDE
MTSPRFWVATLATLVGMALTAALGLWQWDRAGQKLALEASIEAAQAAAPVPAERLVDEAGAPELLHRRVELRGRWLPEHTVFLDNRQMQQRPGFYVVTPLRLSGSDAVVLVQRGWAPRNFQAREQLPPVATPPGEVTVQGRIAPAPSKLYAFDAAETGPIRQNLDLAAFRKETGLPLLEGSVQQVGRASEGLLRDWPVAASGASKNYGYAFQWWALCAALFAFYVWFQFIHPRRREFPRA